MANGRVLLECIGLQMFNYQLTYLPTLEMRFCMIKKKNDFGICTKPTLYTVQNVLRSSRTRE